MLTFLVLAVAVGVVANSFVFFPLVLSCFVLFFLSMSAHFFNSPLVVSYVISDEVSLFMVYMLVFVLYISWVSFPVFTFSGMLCFMGLLISSYLVFTSSNLLLMYVAYEVSLLPIVYIIVKYGSYPERSLSAFMLISYTVLLSMPFMGVLWVIYFSSGSFVIPGFVSYPVLIPLMSFFAFAVKLPLYGLHFWLPMAHVEAPTFGSMILAGVLLKLGGVGLMRLDLFLDFSDLRFVILSYVLFCYILSSVSACTQSDFKRLVAYSSVVHMTAVPLLLLANSPLAWKSIIMIMFFHGMSSSLLFFFVGLLYSIFGTRQLSLMRGFLLLSPFYSTFLVLVFFFTLPAPPFPSFLGEVFFLISSYLLCGEFLWVALVLTFLALVFNLVWLSSILFFSPHDSSSVGSVEYKSGLVLFGGLLFSFMTLLIIPLF